MIFNMQAFSWASHLKHWILKMIVWHEMERKKVKGKETSKVTLQESDPGTGNAIGQLVIQLLKGKLFRQREHKIFKRKGENLRSKKGFELSMLWHPT